MLTRYLGLIVTIVAVTGGPAFAQVTRAPEGSPWITMVIALVLIAAVAVASFMGSKRGHQD